MRNRSASVSALLGEHRERQARVLKCGFVLGPHPSVEQLRGAKLRAISQFLLDMKKQGWDWTGERFVLSGPVPNVEPSGLVVDIRPQEMDWLYFIRSRFTRELPIGMEILVPNPSGSDPDDTDPIEYPEAIIRGVKK